MWAAWSTADQLKAWWGPKGCAIDAANLEFRPGGFFRYAMRCTPRRTTTDKEIAALGRMHDSMAQGFSATLDQLARAASA